MIVYVCFRDLYGHDIAFVTSSARKAADWEAEDDNYHFEACMVQD